MVNFAPSPRVPGLAECRPSMHVDIILKTGSFGGYEVRISNQINAPFLTIANYINNLKAKFLLLEKRNLQCSIL